MGHEPKGQQCNATIEPLNYRTMPNPIFLPDAHCFSEAEQQRFAQLSGDVNPMHVDALAARRLVTGCPVVHGIHTLLQGLERLPAERWPASPRLECDFLNPTNVGDTTRYSMQLDDCGGLLLLGEVGGLTCTHIKLSDAADVHEVQLEESGTALQCRSHE